MNEIGRGLLKVVSPKALDSSLQRAAEDKVASERAAVEASKETAPGLAALVDTQFSMMQRHRSTGQSGWNDRMLAALRTFNGQYDAQKLAEIKKFGGSDVYARLIAVKCRGASSLLRDVYLTAQKPWGLSPPADPDIPPEVLDSITQLVAAETQMLGAQGMQIDVHMIRDRTTQLLTAARDAAKKNAARQAKVSEDKLQEILEEGGFYKALSQTLADVALFPFACMKGPVVKIVPSVKWVNGQAVVTNKPRLTWTRVSPFDLWFTPGVSDIEDAEVIERIRLTRADLNDLLDLPGYHKENIKKVLDHYGRSGFVVTTDGTDSERAVQENRESPTVNSSGLIDCLEFHGNVQGRALIEAGMDKSLVPDELRDYFVQVWKIGNYVIKTQIAPSPRKRHPYYITSFEKVPGTPVGNALPDILSDIQDVANATLRALVNNLSISSGPQVWVNEDRLADSENGDEMFPWKRWRVKSDPMNATSTQPPISFFQPNSNAQELLGVYQQFVNIADELSAIPKYLSGSGAPGGAGRTASGLAMLMGNASKILQTVAANIDRDVIEPALQQLYDIIMLTDTSGLLTGQEGIVVKGVSVAVQKETQRSRQLEFLQLTANPLDVQIMGPTGRAAVLRAVASTIGLEGEEIVPSDDELQKRMMQPPGVTPDGNETPEEAAAQAQGGQQGPPTTGDTGPRTNLQQQRSTAGSAPPRVQGGV